MAGEFHRSRPVHGKVFRIYRDVRFSRDKTPYNTRVRMGFSPGNSEANDCVAETPKFYFSLEPETIVLGCGVFEFTKEFLNAYRDAVIDDKKGRLLTKIIKDSENQRLRLSDPHYKRLPRGYDNDHPRADFLRHKGLAVWHDLNIPKVLSTDKAVGFCVKQYETMLPLYNWLETL